MQGPRWLETGQQARLHEGHYSRQWLFGHGSDR
jgi:hypothetical protein